jgi:predicted nucleic acid-binding protein
MRLSGELCARGVQVCMTDASIVAAAVSRATLWTRDRHFEAIADIRESLDVRLLAT